MTPTIKIYLDTDDGPAIIASTMEFDTLGTYAVAGPGKGIAKEWVSSETGAFGNTIGDYAAPCDLHYAAMWLQQNPEPNIRVVKFEGEVKEYDSRVPEGSCT
jgi:hypothetical protein